ncbi:hypothetical protein RhiirA5_442258 [Rhizophagus irregularis]|uniref:Uncharacterized protein n=1 Tax=Rhizophagus irregularis TaxID=588596 RepID=A0A2N0NEW6_9GLOM|nr:hypothetical protein RhiirA5_442258 [Rhizophagus irregularis]
MLIYLIWQKSRSFRQDCKKLRSDIIVDPLPIYELNTSKESCIPDYFNALLESKMIESQNKSPTLTDSDITKL